MMRNTPSLLLCFTFQTLPRLEISGHVKPTNIQKRIIVFDWLSIESIYFFDKTATTQLSHTHTQTHTQTQTHTYGLDGKITGSRLVDKQ